MKYRIEELDPDFFTKPTPEMGWAIFSNGDLLSMAEKDFDIFLTSDKNLNFQQAIPSTSIQIVLLKAKANIYDDLLQLYQIIISFVK